MGLAPAMKGITEDILRSSEARAKSLKVTKEEVRKFVRDCRSMRDKEGKKLKKDLIQGVTDRKAAVAKLIKESSAARKEMSNKLRRELAQDKKNRRAEVKKTLFAFRSDLKEAALSWQGMTASLRQMRTKEKTGYVATPAEGPPKKAPEPTPGAAKQVGAESPPQKAPETASEAAKQVARPTEGASKKEDQTKDAGVK